MLKDTLTKLKLIDQLEVELPISKFDFVQRLSAAVDQSEFGLFSDSFDAFSSSKNEWKGQVSTDGFKLKKRRRFFEANMQGAVATGTFTESRSRLIVNTEISGYTKFFAVFYSILLVFYSIGIVVILVTDEAHEVIALPFLLIHAAFMILLPYFILRRSVKRLKYELEREFFFLTKEAMD